jgi:hypothetical protein
MTDSWYLRFFRIIFIFSTVNSRLLYLWAGWHFFLKIIFTFISSNTYTQQQCILSYTQQHCSVGINSWKNLQPGGIRTHGLLVLRRTRWPLCGGMTGISFSTSYETESVTTNCIPKFVEAFFAGKLHFNDNRVVRKRSIRPSFRTESINENGIWLRFPMRATHKSWKTSPPLSEKRQQHPSSQRTVFTTWVHPYIRVKFGPQVRRWDKS